MAATNNSAQVSDQPIQYRIAEALKDAALRDVLDAGARAKARVVALREAYGVTVDDDENEWRKLSDDAKRDLPSMTQSRMQEQAVYLWESNLLANRLVELPVAYLLAEGARLVGENEITQEWLDRFWFDPINQMDLKLPKKVRELALFGEQCYPAFVNKFTGQVRLGYLDPSLIETVVTDPDNGEQPIGIVTKRNNRNIQRRYKVIVNGPEQELFTVTTQRIRNTFQDGECFFFAINDLSKGKRGRSDLLAQMDWLDAYDQFLFGEIERAAHLRAFIWDVVLTGATPEEIKKRAKEIAAPKPNSVRVHNDSEKWTAESPELKAQESDGTARLVRNHILGGGTLPEHWFGGGGDVNRATAAEMGDPTFKVLTMRQTFVGYMLETIGRYVIRKHELAEGRREPDLFDPIYKVTAQWPEMVARDTTKYAAALQQVTVAAAQGIDLGLLTQDTAVRMLENISGRLGVEFDAKAELEGAREEASKRREDDVFNNLPPDPEETGDGSAAGN